MYIYLYNIYILIVYCTYSFTCIDYLCTCKTRRCWKLIPLSHRRWRQAAASTEHSTLAAPHPSAVWRWGIPISWEIRDVNGCKWGKKRKPSVITRGYCGDFWFTASDLWASVNFKWIHGGGSRCRNSGSMTSNLDSWWSNVAGWKRFAQLFFGILHTVIEP